MKPPFALSLTFDGIRLLHRAAGGWRVVGEVALDTADLGAALGDLRKAAEALEPDNFFTKLLLPNEQIKYLTIDTPGMDDLERRAASAEALSGATPYDVADLAYDISVDGDQTHVAAVARETLAEAEGFAAEHNFRPLSFAAIPGENAYLGEPHFGQTSAAAELLPADEELTPDGIAVVVIGDALLPEAQGADNDKDAEEELDVAAEELEQPATVPAVAEEESEVAEETVQMDEVSSETASEDTAEEPSLMEPVPPIAAPPVEPAAPEAVPTVGFASRRAAQKNTAPKLDGAHRLSEAAITAPVMPADDTPAEPEPPKVAPPVPALPEDDLPADVMLKERSKPAKRNSAQDNAERERMTVFGARQSQAPAGSPPRVLGMALTAGVLVLLAGVAGWASVFMNEGNGFAALFGGRTPEVVETAPAPIEAPEPAVQTAALEPVLTDEDTAVLDALSVPQQPEAPRPLTDAEIDTKYATDGIWTRAPIVPPTPASLSDIDSLFLTKISPVTAAADALALPAVANFNTDKTHPEMPSPAAAGTRFTLDSRGLVVPTPNGAMSPDGFLVFRGAPPATPPAVMARLEIAPEAVEADQVVPQPELVGFRPKPRPGDLQERVERFQLGGLSRNELAAFRPSIRPLSVQEQAAAAAQEELPSVDTDSAVTEALAEPDPLATATRFATATSIRPDVRPKSFARTEPSSQPQAETRVASAAAIAPRTVTPSIPSRASVAKAATTPNAINLRSINLIGVYGKPSNRRALVRLSSGRYKKVVVGDKIDGGVVSAIGDGELRYRKRGKDLVLRMPN